MLVHTATSRRSGRRLLLYDTRETMWVSFIVTHERMRVPIVEWTMERRQIIYYAPKILFILWMALWFHVVIENASATLMPSVRANRSLCIRNVAIANRNHTMQTNLDILFIKRRK